MMSHEKKQCPLNFDTDDDNIHNKDNDDGGGDLGKAGDEIIGNDVGVGDNP